MVKVQPTLLLRAMFGSVAMQQQESVSMSMAHAAPKAIWMSLVWTASWDIVDIQGLHRASPLPPLATGIERVCPAPHLGE